MLFGLFDFVYIEKTIDDLSNDIKLISSFDYLFSIKIIQLKKKKKKKKNPISFSAQSVYLQYIFSD